MKILRTLALVVLICGAIYLVALYFAHPQCKFDGNPFDCDDDTPGPIFQDMTHIED